MAHDDHAAQAALPSHIESRQNGFSTVTIHHTDIASWAEVGNVHLVAANDGDVLLIALTDAHLHRASQLPP